MAEERTRITGRYCGHELKGRDLLVHARSLLAERNNQLLKIQRRTRSELAKRLLGRRRLARSRGYENGLRAARIEIQRELLCAHNSYAEALRLAQGECLELALTVAERVIGSAIKSRPETLLRRIRQALKSLVDSRPVKIFVHQESMAVVENAFREEFCNLRLEVMAGDDVKPGDARVETIAGTVELSCQTHLELIRAHLQRRQEAQRV